MPSLAKHLYTLHAQFKLDLHLSPSDAKNNYLCYWLLKYYLAKLFKLILTQCKIYYYSIEIKKCGWTQIDNTETTIPRYHFMYFYVFKMAVAIAFLCENAVEAIQISSISMILSLNCFYSIYAKKRNSHGHLKCIKSIRLHLEVVV